MTIQITKPEVEALIAQRLKSGVFKDAEDVILQALRSSESETEEPGERRDRAIERLMTFGKRHGLSLGGLTIRELRDEARASEVPFKTGRGLLANYGEAPSAEEIDANRADMFRKFGEDF